MYCDIITVGLLCLACAAISQRPPYGSQFFYLNPNNVANSNLSPQYQPTRQWFQPATSQMRYMQDTADPAQQVAAVEDDDDDDDDESEAMQFHSQDGAGGFAFGYAMPDQVRIESRNMDGTVRGSYSYLDPTGRTVKVQYWDDGAGFHSSGNNVPENIPEPVRDTPEVQAARDEHFRAYQQVLERNAAYADYLAERRRKEQGTSDVDDDDDIYTLTDQHQNLHPEADYDDAGVSVDSENHSNTPVDGKGIELSRYPKLQIPQNLFDPSQVHDPKLEAVIVENPEILGPSLDGNSVRSGKSMPVAGGLEGPLSGTTPRKGFSYSFQHTIPMYVEVKTVMDDSVGQKYGRSGGGHQGKLGPEADDLRSAIAKLVNSPVTITHRVTDQDRSPIVTMHDAHVAPYQRDGLNNPQTQPLHHENDNVARVTPYQRDGLKDPQTSPPLHLEGGNGGGTSDGGAVVGDSGVPSTRLLPPLSVSQRAAYFGAIPVAAVHDAQVSPKQRDGLRNHQLLPVYIEHAGEEN